MAAGAKTRNCPYCKEEVKADAVRCKHCRSAISPEEAEHGGTCPYCKEQIHPEAIKCKHCGSAVGPAAHAPGGCGCGCGCGSGGGVGGASEADVVAFRETGGFGTSPDIDPDCASRLVACNLRCAYRHRRDPLMQQACRDSCMASYRLCRSFSSGNLSFF